MIQIQGDQTTKIDGITHDSRKVQNNFLFICITGFVSDGHDFISQAVKNGATAIMVERDDVDVPEGIARIRVSDSRKAMALVSKRIYGAPDEKMKIIGITGTNGKTTTTYLIKSILESAGEKTGIIGTISNMIGDREIPASRTTPEAPELFYLLDNMVRERVNCVAMEVSSHSLELNRVEGCRFEVGVFTNLTRDHLDFHKTFENYVAAKAKLFKQSKKTVINIDDKYSDRILKDLNSRLITYAIHKDADVTADNISIDEKGVRFKLKTGDDSADIAMNIPGIFTVYNALAAAAACYAIGVNISDIKNGLENVRSVPGRFEVIENDRDYTILLDYAHTPDGLENILKTVNEFARARIITLFGAGGDRDATKRPEMGKIAGKYSDLCIITSDNPRTEEPMEIIRQIEKGVKYEGCEYVIIENRLEAIKYALNIGKENDVIILAGKGHENYQILKDRVIEFDEKKIVRELLDKDDI